MRLEWKLSYLTIPKVLQSKSGNHSRAVYWLAEQHNACAGQVSGVETSSKHPL